MRRGSNGRTTVGSLPILATLFGSLLAAAALALLAPAPAVATPADDPVDLGGAYVLDRAGVLGGDTSAVREAIDRLFEERGIQLFVVYVDAFTGTSSDQDWANETAISSGLGDRDILLAIATDERIYSVSVADAFPLTDDQLADVATNSLIPGLRDDDWAGGAAAYADGLSGALAPSPVPLVIGGVVVAGAGTAVIVGAVRRRRAKKQVRDAAAADIKTLVLRAGKLLVELDDALKTSEQELGFAQAQFGDDQIRDFRAALADAKATAKQAFEIQHKLDDAFPETPEQYRAMTLQLIELAERADATLDAQADSFEKLRRLDRNAPEVLEEIAKEQEGLAARIESAEDTLAGLAARYPKADLDHLTGVPAQARKLTGFAATAVEKARAELAKPKGDAAVAVRAAQQAVGQVGQLLASIDTGSKDLDTQASCASSTPRSSTSSCSEHARRYPPLRTTSPPTAARWVRQRAHASRRRTGTSMQRWRSGQAIRPTRWSRRARPTSSPSPRSSRHATTSPSTSGPRPPSRTPTSPPTRRSRARAWAAS